MQEIHISEGCQVSGCVNQDDEQLDPLFTIKEELAGDVIPIDNPGYSDNEALEQLW